MALRPPRSDMTVADACIVLGVGVDAPWDEVRRAYRSGIRRTHPDLARAEDATDRAARLNAAFAILTDATDHGRRPLRPEPHHTSAPSGSPSPTVVSLFERDEAPTLDVPAGDVFVRVLEAAHDIGDVSYIDPEAGLIQLLLTDGGPAASQLLIVIDETVAPPTASFTLDSMDAECAPDIHDVVGRLGAALAGTR